MILERPVTMVDNCRLNSFKMELQWFHSHPTASICLQQIFLLQKLQISLIFKYPVFTYVNTNLKKNP
jgi:hypothetical protein